MGTDDDEDDDVSCLTCCFIASNGTRGFLLRLCPTFEGISSTTDPDSCFLLFCLGGGGGGGGTEGISCCLSLSSSSSLSSSLG